MDEEGYSVKTCFFQEGESLETSWVFPFQRVPEGKRLVLYGAGKVGQAFYQQLVALSWAETIFWVDQNFRGYGLLPDGSRILAPEEIAALSYDFVVIAVADRQIASSIMQNLVQLGILEEKLLWGCLPCRMTLPKTSHFARLVEPAVRELKEVGTRLAFSTDQMRAWQSRIWDEEKVVLPRLVVELTNRCTLRCRHCNNLMPFVKKPWDAEPEQVVEDLHRVLGAVDGIVKVELLGGGDICLQIFGACHQSIAA